MVRRILAAIAIAIVVAGFVVLHEAERSDATFTIVSGPPDPVIPVVIPKGTTRYEVVPTGVKGTGSLFLEVATYLEQPKDTVALDLLDGDGLRMRRCVFPPSSYHDNGNLVCRVPDISRVHGLRVTRIGTAKVALYANQRQAGRLVRDEATSTAGRVSTVLSRIAVPLPNGLGSSIFLIGLLGSVGLTALVALLCVRATRTAGDTERDGSPWVYTDPYYYRADHTPHHPHDAHQGSEHDRLPGGDTQHEPGTDAELHSSSDSGSTWGVDSGGDSGDSSGGDSDGGDPGGGGGG